MSKWFKKILVVLIVVLFSGVSLATDVEEEVKRFGKVLEVRQVQFEAPYQVNWFAQEVTIRLLSGPEKNKTITITNSLTGHPYFDVQVKKSDRVILDAVDLGGGLFDYYIADYYRGRSLGLITLLFSILVIGIGGRQGIKALLSLAGMIIVIISVILPLVLKGYNPILVTVGLCSLLTILFTLYVVGRSKKTLAAILGTIGGLIAAGILAFFIGSSSHLSGLASEEAQFLRNIGYFINYQGLLFSGMIIGSLGAILDVGISISSAMDQIKQTDPTLGFKALFTKGILIGRDLIATMSNTLILAYVGSSLPVLLYFHANDRSWQEVMNLDLIATEIVRALTGSIGLTLAIPITAFISALLFCRQRKDN